MEERAQNSRAFLKPSPGTPIPPLPVLVQGVRSTAEGFLEFFSPDPAGDDPQHPLGPGIGRLMPPEELYLRELMDLDLSDGSAILEFTKRFGRLEKERWKLLPDWLVNDWQKRGDPPELERIDQLLVGYNRSDLDVEGVSHIEVFRLHARILRDAVRLWTSASMTGSIRPALERWESLLGKPQDFVAAREKAGMGPEDDEAFALYQAAEFFTLILDSALVPYHPRLELIVPGVVWPAGVPAPGLYSAMALQLYNHIVEGAVYRRCENCDRIFVRQRDRATQGRYRTEGLMYCSKNCAWAAGQRKWREGKRRRREAAEMRERGLSVAQIAKNFGVDLLTITEWLLREQTGAEEEP